MQIQSVNMFNSYKRNYFNFSGVSDNLAKNSGKKVAKKFEMVIPNGLNKHEKMYYALNKKYPKSVTERWFVKGEKGKNVSSKDLVVIIEENVDSTERKIQEPMRDTFTKNIFTEEVFVDEMLTLAGAALIIDDFSKNKKEKLESNN